MASKAAELEMEINEHRFEPNIPPWSQLHHNLRHEYLTHSRPKTEHVLYLTVSVFFFCALNPA